MTRQPSSALATATISTFEELGFVFPELEITEEQAAAALAWRACVSFRGPVDGALEVRVTDGVADELAANMLGLAHEVDSTLKQDALGELANVVCGNLVPTLRRPEDVFGLTTPQVDVVEDGADWTAGADVHLAVGVDEGRAELALFLEAPAEAESIT